jgi:hypothetical protein
MLVCHSASGPCLGSASEWIYGILCILIDFYASNFYVSDFSDSLLITDANEPSNSL